MASKEATEKKTVYVGNIAPQTEPWQLAKYLMEGLDEADIGLEMEIDISILQNTDYACASVTLPADKRNHVLSFHRRMFMGRELVIETRAPENCMDVQNKENVESTAGGKKSVSKYPVNHYPLIDIGACLTHKMFQPVFPKVMSRARKAGLENIIVIGLHIRSSVEAMYLSHAYPGFLYFTAGVHPHDAKRWDSDSMSQLRVLTGQPECVAIGECGLDFNRNFSTQRKQLEVFEKQVQLACEIRKPLFLHEREASDALIEVLNRYYDQLPPTVVHCFTGKKEHALKYLAMGFYIGITGYLWKDKSKDGVRQLLLDGDLPLDKLMLETDAPFMFPHYENSDLDTEILNTLTEESKAIAKSCAPGYKSGMINEPAVLPLVTEMVAACMKMDPMEVATAAKQNTLKFFDLENKHYYSDYCY